MSQNASNLLPLDGQLCFSLYGASMAINRTYKPMLDALGMTYPQYLVMSALWEKDDQTIGAIATRLGLEPSTITPLVKRLETAGFLTRQRNPADERQVNVRLTKSGESVRVKTGCLTDALLEKSGMDPTALIDLNMRVQALRNALAQSGFESA